MAAGAAEIGGVEIGILLLKLVIILLAAKLGGWLSEKIKQPAVLGELIFGVLLGASVFGKFAFYHPFLEQMVVAAGTPGWDVIFFLSELGVILLLFQVGLESNVYEMLKAGLSSTLVAIIGVVLPLLLGFGYIMTFGKNIVVSGDLVLIALFIGGTLVATSVGITARVLQELKKQNTEEGKIVLGAAVIDDVLGLIVLAVVVGVVEVGKVSLLGIGKVTALSIVFLVGTIWLGILLVNPLSRIIRRMKVKYTFVVAAVMLAATLAYIADLIGLATIVGSFAAGLILERADTKTKIHRNITPVVNLFAPIFFVVAGSHMDVGTLANVRVLVPILILTVIAIVGKILAGYGAAFHHKKVSKYAIGVGMIPRGEVGLIFAGLGLARGVFDPGIYSLLIVVVMITTFVTPPWLVHALKNVRQTG